MPPPRKALYLNLFKLFSGSDKDLKNFFKTRKYYIGFTLAEVLITLGIIGVVTALTLPVLIQKYQEQVYIAQTKRAYNLLSRAVQSAVLDNGLPETWDLSNPENMIKPLMPYLKIVKYCTSSNGEICYNKSIYTRNKKEFFSRVFNGDSKARPAFRLNDGTAVGILVTITACRGYGMGFCGEYMVDVNGEKAPNTYGKDIFIFNLTKNGQIMPYGTPDWYNADYYDFEKGCLDTNSSGFGCSGWVVINENMDYWHCEDLSWNGKHKCD